MSTVVSEYSKARLREMLDVSGLLNQEQDDVLKNFLVDHHEVFSIEPGERGETDLLQMNLRPFHMALVLMRFRCASKPNRVECASDAHWSCSHERQYLVDQLALPRLCM